MMKSLITSIFILIATAGNAQYFKGDGVADMELGYSLYQKNKAVRLSQFKDQFILIDIMSINCSSCLKALPKYDTMQALLQSQAKLLILVTNPKKQAEDFFIKTGFSKLKNLTFIAASEELINSFNVNATPLHIWLGQDRQIKAITGAEYVSLQNIMQRSGTPQLPPWPDISLPPYEPLFTKEQVNNSNTRPNYYSIFQGYLRGLRTGNTLTADTLNDCYYWELTNLSIPALYNIALQGLDLQELTGKRFKLLLADTASLYYYPANGYRDAWRRKHNYSLQYRLPWNITIQQRSARLLADLNTYLGLNGRIEQQELSCWVIDADGSIALITDTIKAMEKKEIKTSIRQLVRLLNSQADLGVFVLGSTSHDVQLVISYDALEDVNKLTATLKRYGLAISPQKRSMDVFILSE